MKIKFVALILVLLLCLSSCDNMTVSNKPDNSSSFILMSAEIQESKVPSTECFAVQIGIGNLTEGFMPNATMTVWATSPNLIITAPDGSKIKNEYTYEYSDFNGGKYQTYKNSERKSTCRYFETYLFEFEVAPEDHRGRISFEVCAEFEIPGHNSIENKHVDVYYKVRNGKIRISSENKDYTTSFLTLLDKICKAFDR